MGEFDRHGPILDIVNFADRDAAVALARDVDTLGYRHRIEKRHALVESQPQGRAASEGCFAGIANGDIRHRHYAADWWVPLGVRTEPTQ